MFFKITRPVRLSRLEPVLGLTALVFAILMAVVAAASAHEVKAGDLVLHHPWARATPSGAKVAGGFMTIENTGTEPDRLVSGSVGFAGRVEIHEMAMEGDIMRMRPLADGLEIPAGGSVTLKPGSFHVMFMGLNRQLAEGETVKGTLVFERAGPVEVEFTVEAVAAGAGQAKGHGHGGPDGHGMQSGQ